MMEVKICGLTNLEDALLAARAGADYLGFIMAESPRRLSPGNLSELTSRIREEFSSQKSPELVGVFLNQPLALINRIAEDCSLDYIQLHGRESPKFCCQVNLPVIKTLSIKNRKSLNILKVYQQDYQTDETIQLTATGSFAGEILQYDKYQKNHQKKFNPTDNIIGYLLDTYYPDKGGGGGVSFNWQFLKDSRLQKLSRSKKLFLAGGLNPENIKQASRQPNITGLDASSGLESNPGKKDPDKIKLFFKQLADN